jgi:hypothetical protein
LLVNGIKPRLHPVPEKAAQSAGAAILQRGGSGFEQHTDRRVSAHAIPLFVLRAVFQPKRGADRQNGRELRQPDEKEKLPE